MKIELREPRGDKNWGIEIYGKISFPRLILSFPAVKAASGFIQCCDEKEGYYFYEFWTGDENAILNASEEIEKRKEEFI